MTPSVETYFTLVMPLDAPYSDVENMAKRGIRTSLGVSSFDITKIVLIEEGEIETPKGKVEGKRYKVSYQNHQPN